MDVLDLGCGEGKNEHYLTSLGVNSVDAVEISAYALRNAQNHFGRLPNVTWIQEDVRTWKPTRQYDLAIMYGLLHCLGSDADALATINLAQSAVRTGGTNIVCAFNSRRQELDAHPGFVPLLLPHAFYLEAYAGWDVSLATDSDLTESHPHNKITHTHSMTRIIARKTR